MKGLSVFFSSLGIVGALAGMCLLLFSAGLTIYGIYLAFSASIILGIVCLFLEPSPLIFGIAMFFFDKNLPELLMQWLNS